MSEETFSAAVEPASSPLPGSLLIFPLEGALLLPHAVLPLHIFEPRYRNLVELSLGRGRMIGMIQPRISYPHPIPDKAELFETGCVGRLISFSETEDGRFLIALRGISRFRTTKELEMIHGVRQVSADYSLYEDDLGEPSVDGIDMARVLEAARRYLRSNDVECDWEQAQSATPASLTNTLSMMCPFDPREKQALLECESLVERCNLLISLLEMGAAETHSSTSGLRH